MPLQPRKFRSVALFVVCSMLVTALIAATAGAATTTRGGGRAASASTMTIALAVLPGSLDTAHWEGQGSNEIWASLGLGDTILRYKPIGGLVPPPAIPTMPSPTDLEGGLAQSWKQDAKGNVTLKLRSAKSGYGDTLTAKDVKWTFDRGIAIDPVTHFNFNNASINLKNPLTIINAHTLRVNVTKYNPQTVVTLTSFFHRIYDSTEVKKHITAKDKWGQNWLKTHTADFGAWVSSSFTPNSELRLKANPNYWGGAPKIQNVVIRAVPDPGNRLQLIKSGSVDFTSYLNYDQYASLAGDKNVTRVSQPVFGTDTLSLDFGFKPFSDARVRRAVSMGIDRAAIVQGVYKGFGSPAKDQLPITVPHPALPEDPSFKYNPTGAKKLLAQAGYPHGFKFTLVVSPSRPGPYSGQIGVFLQSQLKKIGLTVNIRNVPGSADYQNLVATGKPDAFLYESIIPWGDPGFFFNIWHNSDVNVQDYKGYKNPQYNKLAVLVSSVHPGAKRNKYIAQADAILDRDVAWVPLVEPLIPYAFNNTKVDTSNYHTFELFINIEDLSLR
jgi:peptide/nickel transport system substrate-binding protein